jgi:hypothetical protein
MKSLDDLKLEQKQVRQKIKEFATLEDFTDDDQSQLTALKSSALKLDLQITAREEAIKAANDEEEDRKADTKRQIDEAVKNAVAKEQAVSRRLPFSEAPYQAQFHDTWKYDNLDGADLSLAIEVGKTRSVNFGGAAMKAMSLRMSEMIDRLDKQGGEESRKSADYLRGVFKTETKTGIEPTKAGIEAAIKAATDPMYTGGSGIGSDWVGTAYSTAIWEVIRAENRVAAKVPSDIIPDGYASKTWPLESTDMTWYKVPDASASDSTLKVPAATVTASQIATGSKNIPVAKIGARGIYTGELTEDSLIDFAPNLRRQLEISGQEIIESLFIDGDVETSANKNINNIASTPAATDYFLSFDGFRKLPLITTTANALDAGGTLTIDQFLATMQTMGTAGLAGTDPSKVAFIVDGNTYYAMARLPEVKTKDVNSAATVENGFVTRVWGVGVIPSWQMHRSSAKRMANTAGKINATDSSNTTGAIVCVRWDQWKQAYKRRMTIETTRIANADSWEIVALARIGLAYRDGEASAISYNVGV